MKATKEQILGTVTDLVRDFTFYDRKEDEELSQEQLDQAIKDGTITIDEIVEQFKTALIEEYSE